MNTQANEPQWAIGAQVFDLVTRQLATIYRHRRFHGESVYEVTLGQETEGTWTTVHRFQGSTAAPGDTSAVLKSSVITFTLPGFPGTAVLQQTSSDTFECTYTAPHGRKRLTSSGRNPEDAERACLSQVTDANQDHYFD